MYNASLREAQGEPVEAHERVTRNAALQSQTLFLRALTGNAFTTVFAAAALTTTSFPNITFLPALRAGFTLVFNVTRPGMVNLPVPTVSLAPTSARESNILDTTLFFISIAVATASARPPLVMGLPPFIAFIAFIGAMLKLGGNGAKDDLFGWEGFPAPR